MSTLTIVLTIAGALVTLLIVAALLAPKEMFIECSVAINKPKQQVFEYIRHIKNQDYYSVWNMSDPNKRTTYTGTDGQSGFIYTWDSDNKNTGAGAQEIKNIVPGESIICELRFERPMKNVAQSIMTTQSVTPTQTKVSWKFEGPTKFPMSIMTPIFRNMLGKDMQTGLDNLKAILEKQ